MSRRCGFLWSLALLSILAVAATARAQGDVHVGELRFARHPQFDRVVVELDGPARVERLDGPDAGELVLFLEARLAESIRLADTKLPRFGTIRLQSVSGGVELRIEARPRTLRLFRLSNPERIVIDAADPDGPTLGVGSAVRTIPLRSAGGAEPVSDASPAATLAPAPRLEEPDTPDPLRGEADSGEAGEGSEPYAALDERGAGSSTEPAGASVPADPFEAGAEAEAGSGPEPSPAVASAPEPAPREVAAPDSDRGSAAPTARPARSAEGRIPGRPWVFPLGALAGLVVFAGVVLWLRRRHAEASETGASEGLALAEQLSRSEVRGDDAEFITPEEIDSDGSRLGLLEKRLDDEVRARMRLEERLIHVSEELKVIRDRMRRSELRDRPPA